MSQARPTFRDGRVEDHYRRHGYAVIDLLTPEELSRAVAAVERLVPSDPVVFQATLYDPDPRRRADIDQQLRPIFSAALARHLQDQRCFVANLLVKPPSADSELGVHQDWTFVDEPEQTSATAWCPLVDVDEANGTLTVFRDSHLLGPSWRGSPRLPTPFDGLEEAIRRERGTPITCAAGRAVVYDHRLVHWSGPNTSTRPRLAVGVGVAPADVPLQHLHADPAGVVTRYEVDDDFLVDLEFGQPPRHFRSAEPVTLPARQLDVGDLG